jgi:hypothetical protein
MAVVIQDNHFFFADQEVPVASDAVIEPGLAPEQSAVTQRSDGKLVPKASFTALGAEEYGPPNLHEKL